jgi:hypothetical protein
MSQNWVQTATPSLIELLLRINLSLLAFGLSGDILQEMGRKIKIMLTTLLRHGECEQFQRVVATPLEMLPE